MEADAPRAPRPTLAPTFAPTSTQIDRSIAFPA